MHSFGGQQQVVCICPSQMRATGTHTHTHTSVDVFVLPPFMSFSRASHQYLTCVSRSHNGFSVCALCSLLAFKCVQSKHTWVFWDALNGPKQCRLTNFGCARHTYTATATHKQFVNDAIVCVRSIRFVSTFAQSNCTDAANDECVSRMENAYLLRLLPFRVSVCACLSVPDEIAICWLCSTQ